MSIDFVGISGMRTIEFCCDNCGETFDSEEGEFGAAVQVMKAEGWRSQKVGENWEHYCSECQI